MRFSQTIEDEYGRPVEINITLDQAFGFLLAELEEIGPRIASDNPQLAARIHGEVINACVRAGRRFCLKQVLDQTELVN
jgi:hypothetical protein